MGGGSEQPRAKRTLSRTHADYWRSRLFRRTYKQDGKACEVNDFYVRIQRNGRREFFPLTTTNRDAAARKAANIFMFLESNGWDATLARFKPVSNGQTKLELTVGDYLGAVDATRRLRGRTFLNYRNCFRTIVAEVFGIRPKTGENKFDYRTGGNKKWTERLTASGVFERRWCR